VVDAVDGGLPSERGDDGRGKKSTKDGGHDRRHVPGERGQLTVVGQPAPDQHPGQHGGRAVPDQHRGTDAPDVDAAPAVALIPDEDADQPGEEWLADGEERRQDRGKRG